MFKNISYKGGLDRDLPIWYSSRRGRGGKRWKVLDADYDEESDKCVP